MRGACGVGRAAAAILLTAAAVATGDDVAAAKAEIARGRSLLERFDYDGAEAAMTRAIAAAPGWSTTWTERAFVKARAEKPVSALEDLAQALEREPAGISILNLKARVLMDLDAWAESAEVSAKVLAARKDDPYALALHGRALVQSGDLDGGLAELERAAAANPAAFGGDLSDARLVAADWAGALETAERTLRAGGSPATPSLNRILALIELGRWDQVPAAVRDAERAAEGTVAVSLGRAAWQGSPGAGKDASFADAMRHMDAAYTGTAGSAALNAHARILFLNGRVREAQDLLSARGRRGNFETLFWLGATYWRLGQLSEARVIYLDARRRNPRLAEHAKRIDGLAAFVAAIDRDLAPEGGQGADRGRLGFELATHLLTVAEIEVLVRRYLFDRAAAEYERLLHAVTSQVRRAEIEARLPEVRSMAAAHRKLTAAINSGALKLKTSVGRSELTLVKAVEGWFEFKIPAGEGRFPWACLDTEIYCDFVQKAGAEPAHLFGLGALAWDATRSALAGRLFEASATKDPRQRPRIDAFLARRRGTAVPPGGYLWFRNQYVTAEEKGNLEKGLVRWEGSWVTAKDRDQFAKGRKKVGDAWVDAADAELLARGFRKIGDAWISPEDLAAKRSVWADAWTEETEHFTIRTNESESFAKDLGVLAETAWLRLRETHGGAEPKLPKGEKLTLFAFRTYEDYRRHCIEQKAEDFLAAAGFARSDSNTAAGWNKTGNTQQFLQTMVHEAAHLYYFRVAPAGRPPSWYSEGLASQLEGFRWDGKAYRFNGISEGRLPFARDAMKNGTHIPLQELFEGNAMALINSDSKKALLFYAECWALVFWLSQTDDPKYRDGWSRYRKSVDSGGSEGPAAFLGDLRQVEKDWIRFVSGL